MIRFLCSNVTWNEEITDFETQYTQIQADLQAGTTLFSLQIANKLITIFDHWYTKHLAGRMGFFGRNSPLWETSYTLYLQDITKSVQALIEKETGTLSVYTHTEVLIWNRLSRALEWMRKTFSNQAVFMPPNIGSIPFLSPSAISGFLNSLEDVQAAYTLVRKSY